MIISNIVKIFRNALTFTVLPSKNAKVVGWMLILCTMLNLGSVSFENVLLEYLTKPLLMPLLGIYCWYTLPASVIAKGMPKLKLVISALIFSWLGDVALLFTRLNPDFFLLGLAFFLCAHLIYIVLFRKASSAMQFRLWYTFPFAVYAAVLYFLLLPNLDVILKVAVFVYAAVLMLMGVFAAARNTPNLYMESYMRVLIGAIVFMVSDSCIAINTFLHPFPSAEFIIMLTYVLAQYWIITGIRNYLIMNH